MKRALLLGLSATLLVSGCAAIDPMVRSGALFNMRYGSQASADAPRPTEQWLSGVADALDAVDSQRRAYLNAARQFAVLSNAGPLVAAGLGVSSLLVGTLGGPGSRDTAIGLGVGALAALGLTTFYDKDTRQVIYLGAADALGCIIAAYAPLRIRRAEYDGLLRDANALRSDLASLAGESGTSTRWTNQQIAELATRANEAIASVEALPQALGTAEIRIRERAINIVTAVDRELVRTAPDPASVFAVVGGISSGIEVLLPGGFQRPPAAQRAGVADVPLDRQADAVQARLAGLTTRFRAVAGFEQAQEAAASCRLPDLPGLLRVTPPDIVRTVSTVPAELAYVVSGGQGGQSIFLRSGTPGFELRSDPPVGGSTRVTVRVAEAARGRTEALVIADGSGRVSREIILRVVGGAAAVSPSSAGEGGRATVAGGQNRSGGGLNPQEAALVRQQLGLPPEVSLSEESARSVVRNFLAARGLSRHSDREAYDLLIGEARAKAIERPPNQFERALLQEGGNAGNLHRCLLGLGPTDASDPAAVFDRDFRGRLFDFQRRSAVFVRGPTEQVNLPISGELDRDQRRNLERTATAETRRRCGGG